MPTLQKFVILQMTTFHACDNDLNNLIKRLEDNDFLAIEWFETDNMKLNNANAIF